MSEFWIPAVRDPSSRDLQRETRSREDDKHLALLHLSVELTERSRSLDASVSIFLSPSVVTVVATVVVVFLIRVRVRRRRPMWNRARSTHWKIIASSSSSSSWLPVARCASNDEQKCNQSPRVPRGLIDGTRRVQILGRCPGGHTCVFLRDTPVAFVSERSFRDEPSEVNPYTATHDARVHGPGKTQTRTDV